MKRLFLITLSFIAINYSFAGNADLFDIDKQELQAEFAELSSLESYVVENNNISLKAIVDGDLFDLAAINVNSMAANSSSDFAFQWEGFLWGFLCCPVGFFVVAINKNKDHDQKISYWIGVGAGTVLNMIYVAAVGVPSI